MVEPHIQVQGRGKGKPLDPVENIRYPWQGIGMTDKTLVELTKVCHETDGTVLLGCAKARRSPRGVKDLAQDAKVLKPAYFSPHQVIVSLRDWKRACVIGLSIGLELHIKRRSREQAELALEQVLKLHKKGVKRVTLGMVQVLREAGRQVGGCVPGGQE